MKKKSQHFCMKKTKISSINCVCNVHSFTYLILWSLMILQRKNNTIQAFYSNYIMICIKKISCRWLAHRQNTHSMKKCIQRMLACARKNLFRCCIFFFRSLCVSLSIETEVLKRRLWTDFVRWPNLRSMCCWCI